ncbi:MAG: IS110 family transposase [Xanthomonadales bacterium]|nr:IS110 family transposase [Xanthomonadales bacterium]
MNKRTTEMTTVAIDLAKNVFQVAGENTAGEVIFEKRLSSRERFWTFLRGLEPGTEVLMEAGPGAQSWARMLLEQGMAVQIFPARRVAEHRSGSKNDRKDCLAILRAGRDRSIEPVPVKSVEALSLQALHRVRSGYQRRRTAIGNQIRGLLVEHGVVMAQGPAALRAKVDRVLEDATVPIPDLLRELIAELWAEWQTLSARIDAVTDRIKQTVTSNATARRLMTIRGFGPILSSALLCKETATDRFANGRRFAAYFGVVPKQNSSGEKVRLGKMTRAGDAYIRSLAIQGAQSVLQRVPADAEGRDNRRLLRWKQRHGTKGAAVRLANRNLRIAWALLRDEEAVYRPI